MAKRIAEIDDACVACGNCAPTCPMRAIEIYKGVRAVVGSASCVGCGKCAKVCPAGVIEIKERLGNTA